MGTWTLDDIKVKVINRIDNIPDNIKEELVSIANEQRQTISDFVGTDPGSTAIPLKYQKAIMSLTIAETLGLMQLEGADVASIKLGDFTESKGSASNISNAIGYFERKANNSLNNIGRKSRYNRTW